MKKLNLMIVGLGLCLLQPFSSSAAEAASVRVKRLIKEGKIAEAQKVFNAERRKITSAAAAEIQQLFEAARAGGSSQPRPSSPVTPAKTEQVPQNATELKKAVEALKEQVDALAKDVAKL